MENRDIDRSAIDGGSSSGSMIPADDSTNQTGRRLPDSPAYRGKEIKKIDTLPFHKAPSKSISEN